MTLEEKIMEDFKDAMRKRDSTRISTLSFMRAQFSYTALEKKKQTLEDQEVIAVVKKLVKQHDDAIEQFRRGNRQDLVEKEEKELAILKTYLPQEMPLEEVERIVKEVISEIGASGMKDMGRVMKEVASRTGGKADGRMVSDTVRKRLSAPSA